MENIYLFSLLRSEGQPNSNLLKNKHLGSNGKDSSYISQQLVIPKGFKSVLVSAALGKIHINTMYFREKTRIR